MISLSLVFLPESQPLICTLILPEEAVEPASMISLSLVASLGASLYSVH
jgi:hypothetical protein